METNFYFCEYKNTLLHLLTRVIQEYTRKFRETLRTFQLDNCAIYVYIYQHLIQLLLIYNSACCLLSQMCFDEKTKTVFVFGGRVLTNSNSRISALPLVNNSDQRSTLPQRDVFSGLYAYSATAGTWTLLREDSGNDGPQDIRSRIGHSMLLDKVRRSDVVTPQTVANIHQVPGTVN